MDVTEPSQAETVCEIVLKPDILAMLTGATMSAAILDDLGNRDLDDTIDLYETISRCADVKARAWKQIRAGLETLERIEAGG